MRTTTDIARDARAPKILYAGILVVLLLLVMPASATAQNGEEAAAEQEEEAAVEVARTYNRPADVVGIDYRQGTMSRYETALRSYLKRDYDRAEELAQATLAHEPRSIEAKWLLANIYDKTGQLGRMLQVMSELGVREAEESQFAFDVVNRGARGYVIEKLSEGPEDVREGAQLFVDLTEVDGAEQGTELVVFQEGDVLKHPVTLEILNVRQTVKADAEIVQVYDSYSVAEVTRLYEAFAVPRQEPDQGTASQVTSEDETPTDTADLRVAFRSEFEDFLYQQRLAQTGSTPRERTAEAPDYKLITMSDDYDGVGLSGAEGFTMDTDGTVFVADTQNHRVVQLDSDGEFVAAAGFQGSGPEEFQQPVDIETFNDQLVVVERVNHRLNILDQELNHVDIVGSRGTGATGLFESPAKAISYRNELYVLDSGNRRVQVFNVDLEPTQLEYRVEDAQDPPTSFTIVPNQYLVVVDYAGNQVFYYNLGETDAPAKVEDLPDAVAGSSISDVSYLGGSDGQGILAYALDGEHELAFVDAESQELIDSVGRRGSGEGQFNEPVQVMTQPGEIVVLERSNNRLQFVRDLP